MQKIVNRFPILGSSVDAEKLSLTIKGVLLGLVPIIIGIAQFYQLPISEADLTELIQAVVAVIAVAITAYGVIRKFLVKFKK